MAEAQSAMWVGSTEAILAAAWGLGPITFAAPAMLWGALAAAGPVLIHLMARTKAQRVPLPTVRFVIKMQQQTQARQRLKHLLLLLLRMLAILLLVAVLARPTLTAAVFSAGARSPVEAVFCLDDSASMTYRSQNKTRFELARELAIGLLRDRNRFPTGSRLGLLTGSTPRAATRLSPDIEYVRQQVEQLEVGDHDLGVAAMLAHAYALLAEGVLETREIYLFGDLTRRSWQDVPATAHVERRDVRVFCIDVGIEQDTNFALLAPAVPDHTVPVGTAAAIRFAVRAGDVGGQRSLEVLLDGKPRWRLVPVALEARAVVDKRVELTNLAPGLHQGEIRLGPADPLSVDNVRYFTLHVGPLPKVAVVSEPETPVAAIVSAMIAPSGLPADRQRFELIRLGMDELGAAGDPAGYLAIVLTDVATVPQAVGDWLAKYVANGGCLVMVPGPAIEPAGYAGGKAVLAAMPIEVIVADRPVHVGPLDEPHSLLAPFQDGSGLSLSEPAIRRYVRLDDALGSGQVIARLDDGAPAVVVRRLGQGTSVALAFSPVRDWSDFAVDAGPMLVLLNTILAEPLPGTCPARNLRVGQPARLPLPRPADRSRPGDGQRPPQGAPVTITSPSRRRSWTVPTDPNGTTVQAVTDRYGHYLLDLDRGRSEPRFGYSVNTPSDESDLERISMKSIASRFAPGSVQHVKGLEDLDVTSGAQAAAHGLAGWLSMVLLGLLMAESFLSNRFHRQPATDEGSSPGRP